MKISIFIVLISLYSCYAHAQGLTGRITEQGSNKPLNGISVSVAIIGKRTQTDEFGNFKLDLPKGMHEVTITGIGYIAQQRAISMPMNEPLLVSLLQAVEQLKEVIVNTGYQKIAKERSTGSFSLVDHETFNQQVGTDVISRLEGITPTLSVDRRTSSSSIMMVRGLSTLRGDRTPLIILDDFPYSGSLENINPNDVENITILKDAAAASIWGAKAGNGVIVISTKKGGFNKKLQMNFNASTSISSKSNLNEYNNLNSTDAIAVEQFLFAKGYYTSQENSSSKIPLSLAVELFIANRDGKLDATEMERQLTAIRTQDIKKNYVNGFLSNGINQQYSIGLNGGSDKMNWYIFTGYDDNKSELGSSYRRLNLKIDQNIRLTEKIDVGVSMYLTNADNESGRTSLSAMTTNNGLLASYTQFADADGNALPVMKNYRASFTNTLAGGNLLDWNYYPLTDGDRMISTVAKWDLLSNFKLGYTLFRGLKLNATYQYQKQHTNSRKVNSLDSYYVRNLVNQFTQVSGTTITRPVPIGDIYNDGQEVVTSNNLRGQVNYDQSLGEFSLNALAGGEMRAMQTKSNNSTTYGVNSETITTTSVDYVNAYKHIVTNRNSFIPYNNGYSGLANRYISTYANAAVQYKGKYTLSGSARRDASNVFGVATNDLWNPLWSVGVAWLLSEETFINKDHIPYAKLRFSYGSSGNSDGKQAAVTTIVYNGTSTYTRTPYANYSNYANPDLKWETVNTLNLGADLKFFRDRLSFSIDYYVKKSKDLIENAEVDYTGGIGFQIYKNTARITVKGLDLELNSVNTVGAVRWSTSFFANFYRDRIDAYYQGSKAASTLVNGSSIVSGIVGMPVYSIYAYKWAGLNPEDGNPRGYVNGGLSEDYATITGSKSTLADLAYIGSAFPSLTGAIANSVNWKGFSLDFRLAYKLGYYFRRSGLSYSSLYAQRMGNREYSERWQNPGDELITNVPSAIYPAVNSRDNFYNLSEATIISGDHLRLQYIGIGYVFNKLRFTKLPFREFRIRAIANNLGLLWQRNTQGIDPDYPGAVPNKIYSFNLQFSL